MKEELHLESIEELALGTTTEEMKAIFFNKAALHEPSYKLWQLNTRGKRYYYTWNAGEEPIFYPSVTTILDGVMPENKFLTDWKLKLGKEESLAYTLERANYGTFIHGQLAELIISRHYNLDEVRERLVKYTEYNKLPLGFVDAHEEEAKADILAFAKWMRDYDVRPYAVEVSLYSPMFGYAGMIDLAANLREYSKEDEAKAREKKGEKWTDADTEKYSARLDALVDFKSGKKGFYDEYAIQLELYRMMWNENFPDKQITRIFNIAPKDWMKTKGKKPSYSFEEQTENEVLKRVPIYLELYGLVDSEAKDVTIVSGTISLDEDTDNVATYSLAELVKKHKEVKEESDETPIENERPLDELF